MPQTTGSSFEQMPLSHWPRNRQGSPSLRVPSLVQSGFSPAKYASHEKVFHTSVQAFSPSML
jgi:hypothetical protein